MIVCGVIAVAFLLDWIWGDPTFIPHIVVFIGKSISAAEKLLRKLFHKNPSGEKAAGLWLALGIPMFWGGFILLIDTGFILLHPIAALLFEVFICWQCIAARSLQKAAQKVKLGLEKNIDEGRKAVSEIVGRDTDKLDEAGVIRAAVETVAENTCDGVVAPLFYMMIGGAPLAVAYKAVNTLDSMVGYKNEKYRWFGRASAKFDDIANFIPARISAFLLMASAYLCGFDAEASFNVFKRDRFKHASPNSAQSESACAGALGIQLGGGSYYFGKWVKKPYIGDATRKIEAEDISKASQMMMTTAIIMEIAVLLIRGTVFWLLN